ncbi:hypothetical protein [Devosia sp. 1566]|uniref:hypothetical protein n=1 Tax=Devosia sp. 1566 TaxID=2499144 RepID=UPI000FDA352F|nr:hypothetical protein [Devosia sp. 1566]
MNANEILQRLVTMEPVRTSDLPSDQRGIYALIDHEGRISYIGSTSAANENFRKRIHARHRTGSETYSHYFSKVYNCGRMYRCRLSQQGHPDADTAKRLRSLFVLEYCRAVYVPIDGSKPEIERLEAEVIKLAPASHTRWNRATGLTYPEPSDLVDALIEKLRLGLPEREAVERQRRLADG